MKLFLFGIDGLAHWIICNNEDLLPNFTKLRKEGNHALCCVGNPVTWECWTTVLTGMLPYHHGIRTMTHAPDGLLSRNECLRKHVMWDSFHSVGWRVGVTNFPPMAYPAEDGVVDGWILTGALNYPNEASLPRLNSHLQPLDVVDYWQLGVMLQDNQAPIEEIRNHQDKCRRAMTQIRETIFENMRRSVRECPVDVVLHYQHDMDFLQHYLLGSDYPVVLDAYQWYDWAIGEVMEEFGPETIAIVSDHGQMALREFNNSDSRRTPWVGNSFLGTNADERFQYWIEDRSPYWNYVCGAHNHWATFIMWGDGVKHIDSSINDAALEDVMPTCLGAKLINPPPDLDGRVRYDILGQDTVRPQPQIIVDRLADLGYADAPPGIGSKDSPYGGRL